MVQQQLSYSSYWNDRIDLNDDWQATAAIYTENNTSAEASQSQNSFVGSLSLPVASTDTTAFCRQVNNEGDYRYFTLNAAPTVRLEFEYVFDNTTDEESSPPPTKVTLSWEYFPDAWPQEDEKPFIEWLETQCMEILQRDELSYAVCEFCEHSALSFWRILYEDALYKLVLLPEKFDQLYRETFGPKIHPKRLARNIKSKKRKKIFNSLTEFAKYSLVHSWKQLYHTSCPICLEEHLYSEGITLPCQHYCCFDCFELYVGFKVQDLQQFRNNPFSCPDCAYPLPITSFVYNFLSPEQIKTVEDWTRNLLFPPCYSLLQCLDTNKCASPNSMRRTTAETKCTSVFCEVCNKQWCELCLKRIREGVDHREICDSTTTLAFCERYWKAREPIKQKCRDKYPWIQSYAVWRQHDGGAMEWILENGQQCPTCMTGVERVEGCFHMKCGACATHFCYECGAELFPPYYGTHHCWEDAYLQME